MYRTTLYLSYLVSYIICSISAHALQSNNTRSQLADAVRSSNSWGQWSAYSSCSVTCGRGVQTRYRSCRYTNRGGQIRCVGRTKESRQCNMNACKTVPSYQWSQWSGYSACSVTCGKGTQTRKRTCRERRTGRNANYCPGRASESRECKMRECRTAASYEWSQWSRYSSCSATCGRGTQTRKRTCYDVRTRRTGNYCQGRGTDSRVCNMRECTPASSYQWSQWSRYSSCSVTCGKGVQTRKRSCYDARTRRTGNYCRGRGTESRVCTMRSCTPAQSYQWSRWSAYSACSVTCGKGVQTKRRNCREKRTGKDGNYCPGRAGESRECNMKECRSASSYGWSQWSRYSSCSVTCGRGVQARKRNCYDARTRRTGNYCPGRGTESRVCNMRQCTTGQPGIHDTDFDNKGLGIWKNVRTDDMDWMRRSGMTPSAETGPTKDHTTGRGYYMYIESSGQRQGAKAKLVSDVFPAKKELCLKFFYSMKGKAIGTLKVIVEPSTGKPYEVFRKDGEHTKTKEWLPAVIDIKRLARESKLVIQGEVGSLGPGNRYIGKSDIAIDDVYLSMERCKPADFKEVTEFERENGCAPGISKVSCRGNPCLFAKCPAFPSAKCIPNNCGACRPKYYDRGVEIIDCYKKKCGPGVPAVLCQKNPCDRARCPAFPLAQCVPTFCGVCDATFYFAGKLITDCYSKGNTTNNTLTSTNMTNMEREQGDWVSWGAWSTCSVTCGEGYKVRSRKCVGKNCMGKETQKELCTAGFCESNTTNNTLTSTNMTNLEREHGNWVSWGAWSTCSVTCGEGYKIRSRKCVGKNCMGEETQKELCTAGFCESDTTNNTLTSTNMTNLEREQGNWVSWGAWSTCNVTCGEGYKVRSRTCVGKNCMGKETQKELCTSGFCESSTKIPSQNTNTSSNPNETVAVKVQANGTWGSWGSWSKCSTECGEGRRARLRRCRGNKKQETVPSCVGNQLETSTCSYQNCTKTNSSTNDLTPTTVPPTFRPVGRTWGAWGTWSSCSVTCGEGERTRERRCNGGKEKNEERFCQGDAKESQLCTRGFCAERIALSSWSNWDSWSQCSRTCGEGTRVRYRRCNRKSGDSGCRGSYREMAVCNMNPCRQGRAINGNWGSWGEWTPCTASCDIGKRSRTRACNNPLPSNGGKACPGSGYMTASCLVKACGIDTTFDKGFIEMKNTYLGDNLDWVLQRGEARMGGNMPRFSHTGRRGAYAYIDAYRRNKGDNARLMGPVMPSIPAGCLSFYYSTAGEFKGHVAVMVRYFGILKEPEFIFYKIANARAGPKWRLGQATVSSPGSTYQVIFEGAFNQISTPNQRYRSVIALDDIKLENGRCPQGNVLEIKLPTKLPEHCVDQRDNCFSMARSGQCILNKTDMHTYCKKSCLCQDNLCRNLNPRCAVWAKRGECTSNPSYMKIGCCRSCTELIVNCIDEERACGAWTRQGECQRNPRYMKVFCRKSCGVC